MPLQYMWACNTAPDYWGNGAAARRAVLRRPRAAHPPRSPPACPQRHTPRPLLRAGASPPPPLRARGALLPAEVAPRRGIRGDYITRRHRAGREGAEFPARRAPSRAWSFRGKRGQSRYEGGGGGGGVYATRTLAMDGRSIDTSVTSCTPESARGGSPRQWARTSEGSAGVRQDKCRRRARGHLLLRAPPPPCRRPRDSQARPLCQRRRCPRRCPRRPRRTGRQRWRPASQMACLRGGVVTVGCQR